MRSLTTHLFSASNLHPQIFILKSSASNLHPQIFGIKETGEVLTSGTAYDVNHYITLFKTTG